MGAGERDNTAEKKEDDNDDDATPEPVADRPLRSFIAEASDAAHKRAAAMIPTSATCLLLCSRNALPKQGRPPSRHLLRRASCGEWCATSTAATSVTETGAVSFTASFTPITAVQLSWQVSTSSTTAVTAVRCRRSEIYRV